MDKTRQRILEKAAELFRSHGIKHTTMDDIASALGMSKKTLYHYFENKTTLVREAIKGVFDNIQNEIRQICNDITDPYEQFFFVRKVMQEMLRNTTHHMAFYELQKWYPEVADELKKHKLKAIMEFLSQNLALGHKAGYYKKSLDDEFIKHFYYGNSLLMMNPEVYPPEKFERARVGREFLKFFLTAISTKKGREHLKRIEQKYSL